MAEKFYEIRSGAICARYRLHVPALQVVFHPENAIHSREEYPFVLDGCVHGDPIGWKGCYEQKHKDVVSEVPYSEVEALIDAGQIDEKWRQQ